MEKKQEQTEQLNNFLEYCKEQIEYIDRRHFVNSVKLYFNKSIMGSVFIKLNEIDHRFFVYHTKDESFDIIVLFIYKKFDYVFN
jgi:hypothetical protein